MKIQGSVMLITGASRGLGHALAPWFARRGAKLLLTARSEEGLRETAQTVEASGNMCAWHVADLADPASLASLAAWANEEHGGVDILLNNGADLTSKPFMETSLDEIDHLVRTNITGLLQLTRLLAPAMVSRRSGVIVNVSSLAGYKPNPSQTVYSATKTGVNGISRALAAELTEKGIRIINVGLPSVGDAPGKTPIARYAALLEQAIQHGEGELFLSPVSKWLMRLYAFWPRLERIR